MTIDDLKVILYLVDATIHTALLFGWSSITEILKENGFFRQKDEDQSDLRILQNILRLENETCFADNKEQGSQRIFDQKIGHLSRFDREKSLKIAKKLH